MNIEKKIWSKHGFKLIAFFSKKKKKPIMPIMLTVLDNQGYSNVCLPNSNIFKPLLSIS